MSLSLCDKTNTEAQRGIFLNLLLASEPPNLHAAKATFLVEPSVKGTFLKQLLLWRRGEPARALLLIISPQKKRGRVSPRTS